MKHPSPATAPDVLHFWLGDGLQLGWCSDDRRSLWFGGGAAQDALVRERFGPLVEQAIDGGLQDWEHPITHRLALVLLLDQFTRNVHRGQARAFAGDARAQRLVRPSAALRCGKRPKRATMSRCCSANCRFPRSLSWSSGGLVSSRRWKQRTHSCCMARSSACSSGM